MYRCIEQPALLLRQNQEAATAYIQLEYYSDQFQAFEKLNENGHEKGS